MPGYINDWQPNPKMPSAQKSRDTKIAIAAFTAATGVFSGEGYICPLSLNKGPGPAKRLLHWLLGQHSLEKPCVGLLGPR